MINAKRLEPFQVAGVSYLASRYHALLADEPGLGKTVQAVSAYNALNFPSGAAKVLVVCPASVRSHWIRVFLEWGTYLPGRLSICSYEQATADRDRLRETDWDLLVMDEAHFLKSLGSKRTATILGVGGVAWKARYKWCLTGTPVLNRPRELYPILKTLCPAFRDFTFSKFAQRYCGAHWDGYGVDTRGASRIEELGGLLRGFMLRRTKRGVFPCRKSAIVRRVAVDLDSSDLAPISALEAKFGSRAAKLSPAAENFCQMGDTSRLLRAIGRAKLPFTIEFVRDLLQTVDKVLVFAYHREFIGELGRSLGIGGDGVAFLWGGMSDKIKSESVRRFASDPSCRVLVGQRTAAGVGVDGLQASCSTAVIAEPSWVPGETQQMIDRLDRVGQKADIVTAYILYAPDTLDETVLRVQDLKTKVVGRLQGDLLL